MSDLDLLAKTIARQVFDRLQGQAAGATCAGGACPVDGACCPTTPGEDSCRGCHQCASRHPEAVATLVSIGANRIEGGPGIGHVRPDLAKLIDHTLLKPQTTFEQIAELCGEARMYGFCSVCVNPCWVAHCADLLRDCPVKVCTVIGFPLGANTTDIKVLEACKAIEDGADELDMVINIGALRTGDVDYVRKDIAAVVQAAAGRAIVKVILETTLLDDKQKIAGCEAAKAAGADFVKTSTGFGGGGATPADIALMRRTVGDQMGVKASGGVGDCTDADRMVRFGATRIGASAGVAIVSQCGVAGPSSGGY